MGLAVPIWAQTSQPTNVKVVAVPAASKPSAAKTAPKPAVIAVKPAAKPAVVPAKPSSANAKAQPASKPVIAVSSAKPAAPVANVQAKPVMPAKSTARSAAPTGNAGKQDQHAARINVAPKPVIAVSGSKDPFSKSKKPQAVVAVPAAPKAADKKETVVAVKDAANQEKKPEPKKVSSELRRDPFVSPVVHLGAVGSGCSSGKRCLAIDQVALKGVVRSENGMIAVVVNAMDKAYFLRENDPVFNGYVTKITSDSIVFKETFRDKLGKELTRDVTKTISRPAA